MGKASKGKGRRKATPITRRDPEAKRRRREAREAEAARREAEEPSEASSAADPSPSDEPEGVAGHEPDGPAEDAAADDGKASAAPGPSSSADKDADPLKAPFRAGRPWALPLAKLERRWTWLEARLMFAALAALVAVLCLWIALRGMKDPLPQNWSELGLREAWKQGLAGNVWRALVGAAVLGGLSRPITRKLALGERNRTLVTLGAIALGIATALWWRKVGVDYSGNLLDWLQQGSAITLFAGLQGISTRLTMLVALVGAALACASGTHINVDIVVRFIPRAWRKYAHSVSCLGAAVVCLVSSWGFFDFVAVTGFKAAPDATAGAKAGIVTHTLGDDFFLWRKQARLDLGALPYVLRGKSWNADDRMTGRQWNAFLEDGFVERYGRDKMEPLMATGEDLDAPRRPFVVMPEGTAAGHLLHALDLVFPFGFLMLALRFLLRSILVLTGFLEPQLEGEDSHTENEPPPPAPARDGEAEPQEAA